MLRRLFQTATLSLFLLSCVSAWAFPTPDGPDLYIVKEQLVVDKDQGLVTVSAEVCNGGKDLVGSGDVGVGFYLRETDRRDKSSIPFAEAKAPLPIPFGACREIKISQPVRDGYYPSAMLYVDWRESVKEDSDPSEGEFNNKTALPELRVGQSSGVRPAISRVVTRGGQPLTIDVEVCNDGSWSGLISTKLFLDPADAPSDCSVYSSINQTLRDVKPGSCLTAQFTRRDLEAGLHQGYALACGGSYGSIVAPFSFSIDSAKPEAPKPLPTADLSVDQMQIDLRGEGDGRHAVFSARICSDRALDGQLAVGLYLDAGSAPGCGALPTTQKSVEQPVAGCQTVNFFVTQFAKIGQFNAWIVADQDCLIDKHARQNNAASKSYFVDERVDNGTPTIVPATPDLGGCQLAAAPPAGLWVSLVGLIAGLIIRRRRR
ncbi:MAG: hypothetical protein H6707_01700 [Deltaproteobacteria bacterium]|nr:hypothetical protein [Deltaproteobacteria bacterium]